MVPRVFVVVVIKQQNKKKKRHCGRWDWKNRLHSKDCRAPTLPSPTSDLWPLDSLDSDFIKTERSDGGGERYPWTLQSGLDCCAASLCCQITSVVNVSNTVLKDNPSLLQPGSHFHDRHHRFLWVKYERCTNRWDLRTCGKHVLFFSHSVFFVFCFFLSVNIWIWWEMLVCFLMLPRPCQ